jgi:hypothetical protein
MTIKIINKGKKISERDIIATQNILNCEFPGDYRKFLLETNGGKPETNEFDIPDMDNSSGINEFLSLNEIALQKKQYGDRFCHNVLPIAYAEGGNFVCIAIGEKAGVYFWDHEYETEGDKSATWGNMFRLASTFSDFFEKIHKFDINQIKLKPGQITEIWVDPDFKPEF